MAGHPQSSHRGLFYKGAIGFGSTGIFALAYSEGTAILSVDTTGVTDLAGNLSISGSGKDLSQNSTGVLATPAGITPSGGTIAMTANSTAIVVPVLYIGAMALAANTTGITIAGAQINTA